MSTTPTGTSASKSRRKHTKEFKQQAVALALRPEIGFRRAAEDLGINESLLRDWAKKSMIEGPDAFRGHGVRTEADARLAALERESRILREERGILKKSDGILRERAAVRYAFIEAHRPQWRLQTLCRVLGVS